MDLPITPDAVRPIDRERVLFANRSLLIAAAVGACVGAFFVLRFLGYWGETDSGVFALMIRWMQEAGGIRYAGSYTHGYAYQVWASTIDFLTGADLDEVLQLYLPLFGSLFLSVVGFVTFRRLLRSNVTGVIAAAVLFLVPELVFTVSRGNHEKLTVSLTLLALLCLLNSFRELRDPGRWRIFASWSLVFYFAIFTLASLNAFFGSGFITATTLTLIFAVIAQIIVAVQNRMRKGRTSSGGSKDVAGLSLTTVISHLVMMVIAGWVLVILVTWYIYPSSTEHNYRLVETAAQRFSVLFLGASVDEGSGEEELVASNPYTLGGTDWSSLTAYSVISTFRWVLFIGSFLTCLVLLFRTLPRLQSEKIERLFLISFYGAFGLQLASSVPIDYLGLHAGTNLQVRIYTYFSLLAVPVFVLGLVGLTRAIPIARTRTVVRYVLFLILPVFFVLSMMKATLDPSVSNRWLFYHPSETQAIGFWNERQLYSSMWLDPEGRLRYAYMMAEQEVPVNGNEFDVSLPAERSAYGLYSSIIYQNTVAWGRPPFPYWRENLPYDNGFTQIYYRIPRTPLQR